MNVKILKTFTSEYLSEKRQQFKFSLYPLCGRRKLNRFVLCPNLLGKKALQRYGCQIRVLEIRVV
jgi:hypothetical protein